MSAAGEPAPNAIKKPGSAARQHRPESDVDRAVGGTRSTATRDAHEARAAAGSGCASSRKAHVRSRKAVPRRICLRQLSSSFARELPRDRRSRLLRFHRGSVSTNIAC